MAGVSIKSRQLTFDYTDKDFDALVAALRGHVTTFFPEVTDFNAGSLVQMLIELFAGIGDRLNVSQDKQVNEANIITAKRLRNVIRHALGIAYSPASRRAAVGPVEAALDPPVARAYDIPIPKGTFINTNQSDPVYFRTTSAAILPAGELSVLIPTKNSEVVNQSSASTGAANQRFLLDETPALNDGSLLVEVDGEIWTKVESFFDSTGMDKHYVVELDDSERLTVIFGDGENGAIPATNADLDFTYEIGGGPDGNQIANTITENSDDFYDLSNTVAFLSFTNPGRMTGGENAESIEQIRFRAPRALKTLSRTVCEEDFSINLEDNIEGVARARAFSSDQDPTLPENHAFVHVVPTDQNAFDTTLNNAGVLDNGDTSAVLESVEGLYVNDDLFISDGTNTTLVNVTTITALSKTIGFAAISGLASPIEDLATVSRTENGLPDPGLKLAVQDLLENDKPMTLTMDLTVLPPKYRNIKIAGIVYIDPDNANPNLVQALAEAEMEDHFDFTSYDAFHIWNIDWGLPVYWSIITTKLQQSDGVKRLSGIHFILDGVPLAVGEDAQPEFDEIVRLDTSNFGQLGGLEFRVDI